MSAARIIVSRYSPPPGGAITLPYAKMQPSALGCPYDACSRRGYALTGRRRMSRLHGLGQVEIDPTVLLVGAGVLAVAFFFFGGFAQPRIRKRRVASLKRRHERLTAKIKRLES